MKIVQILVGSFLLICSSAQAENAWQTIPVDQDLLEGLYGETISRQDGRVSATAESLREIIPSCSGTPFYDDNDAVQSETDYSFYYRPGDPEKLLIYFEGGGACWNSATCLSNVGDTSLFTPNLATDIDIIDEHSTSPSGGIISEQQQNPLFGYTKVFIPSCTGDVHWGSQDMTYPDPRSEGDTFNVYHRGGDNVTVVLSWLRNKMAENILTPKEVVIAGSSAGGYGAIYHTPAIQDIVPSSSQVSLLIDSANGVVSENFYQTAMGGRGITGGVWGIEQHISHPIDITFATGPSLLMISSLSALTLHYPTLRVGQYTAAYDFTQSLFYNVTKYPDNEDLWLNPATLLTSIMEWSARARSYMLLSTSRYNYRFYIGKGMGHVLFLDSPNQPTPFTSPNFYNESSAESIPAFNWVDDMLNQRYTLKFLSRGSDWLNISCLPGCITSSSGSEATEETLRAQVMERLRTQVIN